MNLAEKAYIAGIIDGEGTVTLTRKHSNETPSPHVSVFNCNVALIRWLQKTIGYGDIIKKRPAKKQLLVQKIRKLNQRSIYASYNTLGSSKMGMKR